MINKDIKSFFDAIDPIRAAYRNINFCYLAVRNDEKFHLIQGRLYLNTGDFTEIPKPCKSKNVFAGSVHLSELANSLEEFTEMLLSGSLCIDGEDVLFLQREGGKYDFYHHAFHQAGLKNQHRLNILTIRGSYTSLQQPFLDWELMSAQVPFAGLQDVANEYGVGLITEDAANVEFIAFHVTAISDESTIDNGKAKIIVNAALNMHPDKVAVGYHIHQQQKIIKRGYVDGLSIEWKTIDGVQKGMFKLDVPQDGVLHCFASYDGIMQQHYWVLDPSKILNPRRAAYEAFDQNLELLKQAIDCANPKQRAHQFEAAVACLFWMSGFAIAPIDNISNIQEVSDIIATSPEGHYAVVECTTGLLKENSKLPKLHDRALAVRKHLQAKGHYVFNILPILVTSKSREDISPELEQAERHGILVMAREDLSAAIEQLFTYPDPNRMYNDAIQAVRLAQAKYHEQIQA